MEFGLVDVNDVLNETLVLMENQLTVNNIVLVKKLSPDLPKVKGNPIQLQQVFTNIIVNALHAMPNGGDLTICTCLKADANKIAVVEIAFNDSGCGILKENIGKLFDPFFTTRETGKGTGLGLSLSYGIIKDHKGEISVESEIGKGSTFNVTLPVG